MKIAFQMDELTKLNFAGDSTFMIIEEAYKRNFEVYFYHPNSLSLEDNKISCSLYKITNILSLDKTIPLEYEKLGKSTLDDFNFIFLRQDPPFDMAYITSTFLLEKLPSNVKVINNPKHVRNSPEKILVTDFSHLMPKTLISRDFDTIWNFLKTHKKCVIKPLYGNAGADVFFLQENDFNAKAIIEYFLHTFREQVMVQEFLENVKHGDKRIILINGNPQGVINRVPAVNEIKSNLAAGGTAAATELSEKDLYICNEIGATLKQLELFFVGIDVIDGYLTEINVTSPTGLRGILNFNNINLATILWDELLQQYG